MGAGRSPATTDIIAPITGKVGRTTLPRRIGRLVEQAVELATGMIAGVESPLDLLSQLCAEIGHESAIRAACLRQPILVSRF